MIIQKIVELILKDTAKKYNKPYHVILEIWLSQFKMLKFIMNCLTFKTVKLPSWGKYIASPGKIKKIDYAAKEARRNAKYGKKEDGTKPEDIQV